MGAPPVAESSDLSEWQRSVCNAGVPSPRRTQGTATGLFAPKGSFAITAVRRFFDALRLLRMTPSRKLVGIIRKAI